MGWRQHAVLKAGGPPKKGLQETPGKLLCFTQDGGAGVHPTGAAPALLVCPLSFPRLSSWPGRRVRCLRDPGQPRGATDGTIRAPVSPQLLQSAEPLGRGTAQTGSWGNSGWIGASGPEVPGEAAGSRRLEGRHSGTDGVSIGWDQLLSQVNTTLACPAQPRGRGYWPWLSPEPG